MAWRRGDRRLSWARSASAVAFALGFAACSGDSNGRDTEEAGGEAGTASSGGTAGTRVETGGTDLGGTNGAGEMTCAFRGITYGVGDTFTIDECNTCTCTSEGLACTDISCRDALCERLKEEYESALAVAKVCNPTGNGSSCDHSYRSSLPCGCPTFANESLELDVYYGEYTFQGCLQPPCPPCDPPTSGSCSASGQCEDAPSGSPGR